MLLIPLKSLLGLQDTARWCFAAFLKLVNMKFTVNESEDLVPAALTFRARASYRLGRHLNTSALPQARASHTLGQPQPQPFKYFALNIFREISLILSPRSFSSFMLRLIYQLRENNMYSFFI